MRQRARLDAIKSARSWSRAAIVMVLIISAPALAQTSPPASLDEFRSSLNPQVFQPGGYGPWPEPLAPIFDEAAAKYAVPRELLVVLGQIGSNFENRGDQPTIEFGYGVMALRANQWGGDSLNVAATMLGTTADAVKVDPRLNIHGAAAVLDAYAKEMKIDRAAGLDAWVEPVVKYAGLDAESSQFFAQGVFEKLQAGIERTNSWGETFSVAPQSVSVDVAQLAGDGPIAAGAEPLPQSTDYGPAVWDPAATCNYSTTAISHSAVIIHTIEGSAAGARSWFKNCNAQVSAHYVVSEAGGVWQCVRESQKAWHVGCLNGSSIGIENEGYASSSSHPQSLYNACGDLTKHLCDTYGIPKAHRSCSPGVLGHNDANNCHCGGTHWDPGGGWDWGYFIDRVNGGTPPPPAWAATYRAQSYPSSMTAGSTAIVWAEFNNTGTSHWYHAQTYLGTSSPQDRSSPFCNTPNWPGCNRTTEVDQSDVAQGQVGRFTFILKAPTTPGTYTEKYKLVREGVTWFGPEITWTITVTQSTGTLTGTVRNASNSAAISGATVTLTGVGNATTNSSGVYTFSNVTAGTYTVSVSATGFNPASSSVTVTAGQTTTKDFSLTPSDTQAPTTPSGLTANATSPTTVALAWTASTDNVGVTGYDIRRNGTVIGSSATTSYTDSGATPATTLTYDVRAKDAVPNYSGWSATASATTPPSPPVTTNIFTDGFSGSVGNWSVTNSPTNFTPYTYSTTVNHGTYTGAGAAYLPAGGTNQMYRALGKPFAQGRVWGYFYDSKGGWKTGICGNSYRQALSLRDTDGAAKAYIDNEFYNAPDNSKYYWRTIGVGGVTHTAYATRNAATTCDPAWIYFETAVTPGAPGASPTGSFVAKVTDGAGTTTTTQSLTSDFFSWGIGRVHLGLGVTSTNEGYWDDIGFEAKAPDWPLMGTPTGVTASSITWAFTPRDNNLFGYDMADAGGTVLSPNYPATGWIARNATSWTESGLTANTQYTRKVRGWNGTLNGAWSLTASPWTLSVAPAAGSVTPDAGSVCTGDSVTWTAVGGFGAGKVEYYKYAWDQNPTYTFSGSEPNWSSGTLTTATAAVGTWYLHVQGYNGANVASGSYDYSVTTSDGPAISQQPAAQVICSGAAAQFSIVASGNGTLTYQWQKDGTDLSNSGDVSGADTATLQIAGVSSDDVGSYTCVVTGACGTTTSDAAALTLQDGTAITQQPVPQTYCGGGPVTFTVVATGQGTLAYQWQKDGADIPGANGSTLEFLAPTDEDAGVYRCVVTSDCGAMTSAEVGLTVSVSPADFDHNCSVGALDFAAFDACRTGPNVLYDPDALPAGCPAADGDGITPADFDRDGDVDLDDFGEFQSEYTGGQ